ncbi:MAG: arginine--tRNA ligase [Candidatus Omnitrophica bacterium]|nr:arginine--tRNA ligase [Candidatus Omnitrophota bacterium]MBL7210339.1 arginine--tRNA ligase [Candidatus Omnitrophota bacterium]
MKNNIQDTLISAIKSSARGFTLDESAFGGLYLDLPTDSRFGDLTTSIALQLSKTLNKSPREIASSIIETIKKFLKDSPAGGYVREIKCEGQGFINFYLEDKYFYERLSDVIRSGGDCLKSELGRGKGVLIEFVSANPTGPLSVAHARQAAAGDVLANIFGFMGFKVKREYYLNDEGNQINILGESVELRIRELAGERLEFPDNYYQGEYIYDIAKEAQGPAHNRQGLGDFAAGYILKIIRKELDDFGVSFDSWFSQKALAKSGKIEKALEYLDKKGFLYEEGGALWFKSTQFGDDKDRVVRKSDGNYTYLAPDIAYHRDKYGRDFERLINIWGPDHHGYIKRLEAAVEALGHPAKSLSIIIVQLATISKEGKPLHMSTRKGQYITLREVLDEVGRDAARFFFLMRRTSSHLDFDLDVARKQSSENPVYYVQYAHARICSILRNSTLKFKKESGLALLKEKEELQLVKKALQFSDILNICLNTEDPYRLTVYLQELAEAFHKFYDLHRVLGVEQALEAARLALIEAVRIIIAAGLDLLGVSKPETM